MDAVRWDDDQDRYGGREQAESPPEIVICGAKQDGNDAPFVSRLELLPCTIHEDVKDAPIDSYFRIEEAYSDSATSSASSSSSSSSLSGGSIKRSCFRGIELLGQRLNLPPSCSGWIVAEKEVDEWDVRSAASNNNKEWIVAGRFSSFTYWNRETLPSEQDLPPQWMMWTRLANSIHKPVTKEEVEAILATPQTSSSSEARDKAQGATPT
ncbi:hypothetical protein QOT17_008857 [Balamuthia mandrillaris]